MSKNLSIPRQPDFSDSNSSGESARNSQEREVTVRDEDRPRVETETEEENMINTAQRKPFGNESLEEHLSVKAHSLHGCNSEKEMRQFTYGTPLFVRENCEAVTPRHRGNRIFGSVPVDYNYEATALLEDVLKPYKSSYKFEIEPSMLEHMTNELVRELYRYHTGLDGCKRFTIMIEHANSPPMEIYKSDFDGRKRNDGFELSLNLTVSSDCCRITILRFHQILQLAFGRSIWYMPVIVTDFCVRSRGPATIPQVHDFANDLP